MEAGSRGQDVVHQEILGLWERLPEAPLQQALTNSPDLVRSMPDVDTKIDAILAQIQAE